MPLSSVNGKDLGPGHVFANCEVLHTASLRSAICSNQRSFQGETTQPMTTRRFAHWWFRFVFSGRFLETFLIGRHRRLPVHGHEPTKSQCDLPMPTVDEAVQIAGE